MTVHLQGIPDAFVARYRPWLAEWVAGMKAARSEPFVLIPLVRGTADVPDFDAHGNVPFVVVVLACQLEGGRIVIRPADRKSEDLIKRHVAMMRGGERPEMRVH